MIGFDNLSDYYDVNLKKARLARFMDHPSYTNTQADLADLADRAAPTQAMGWRKGDPDAPHSDAR